MPHVRQNDRAAIHVAASKPGLESVAIGRISFRMCIDPGAGGSRCLDRAMHKQEAGATLRDRHAGTGIRLRGVEMSAP